MALSQNDLDFVINLIPNGADLAKWMEDFNKKTNPFGNTGSGANWGGGHGWQGSLNPQAGAWSAQNASVNSALGKSIGPISQVAMQVVDLGEYFKSLAEEVKKSNDDLKLANALNDPNVIRMRAALELTKERNLKAINKLEEERAKALLREKQAMENPEERGLRMTQQTIGMLKGEDKSLSLGSMGKMAGEAIGGPIGGAIGEYLGEQAPRILAAPAKMAASALGLVADSLNSLRGPLGPIGLGFDLMGKAIGGIGDMLGKIPVVGELLGPLFDTLAAVPGIIKGIVETLTSFAGMASPAQMKMFQMATEDVMGVIGQSFVPMLEMMRDAVRLFGDTLATILPNTEEVSGAMAEIKDAFAEYGAALREWYGILGPFVREYLLFGLRNLADAGSMVLQVLTEVAHFMTDTFGPALSSIADTLGIDLGMRSSVGAVARSASYTSMESYASQLHTNAYSQPGTTMNDIPKHTMSIAGMLQNIQTWLTQTWTRDSIIAMLVEAISQGLGIQDNPVRQAVEEGAGAIPIVNILRMAGRVRPPNNMGW